jgi:phosphoglycolate phosphatase-like HAD superfamily hydrolase
MIVFDFDGVLVNSLDEVALTVYNAATGSLFTSLAEIPGSVIEMFKRNRYHVQQIGDAIALMNWCIANHRFDSQRLLSPDEYRTIAIDDTAALNSGTDLIYETRKRFVDKDPGRWLALHRVYQPLWDELLSYRKHPLVILTNKNHDATSRLCRHFGLEINAADIYSGDNGATKSENVRRIQDRFGIELFSFVDDSVKNLKDLDIEFNEEKRMLTLLLATWGYTGPEDAGIAGAFGFPVLEQTDLIQLMKKIDRV